VSPLIVFRADASRTVGAGHLSRCLVLADAWRACGARCVFLVRDRPGAQLSSVESRGHQLIRLSACEDDASLLGVSDECERQDVSAALAELDRRPTWLVVDHYGVEVGWHLAFRSQCEHFFVIDDLADRAISADVILNQNLGARAEAYHQLTPDALVLAGPMFAMLRPEFSEMRASALKRRIAPGRHVLVSLGGSDAMGLTSSIVAQLVAGAPSKASAITVALGAAASEQRPAVEDILRGYVGESRVIVDSGNMAALLVEADLVVGAAGSSAWERCCLGMPAVTVVLAANQVPTAAALANCGAAVSVTVQAVDCIGPHVSALLDDPQRLRHMARCAGDVTDGEGARRVLDVMTSWGKGEAYAR
jgi:UDP-2,4-diacetamido-2,4,6-trideoxy-beta-L-altropyranose hydrolase